MRLQKVGLCLFHPLPNSQFLVHVINAYWKDSDMIFTWTTRSPVPQPNTFSCSPVPFQRSSSELSEQLPWAGAQVEPQNKKGILAIDQQSRAKTQSWEARPESSRGHKGIIGSGTQNSMLWYRAWAEYKGVQDKLKGSTVNLIISNVCKT